MATPGLPTRPHSSPQVSLKDGAFVHNSVGDRPSNWLDDFLHVLGSASLLTLICALPARECSTAQEVGTLLPRGAALQRLLAGGAAGNRGPLVSPPVDLLLPDSPMGPCRSPRSSMALWSRSAGCLWRTRT